MKSSTVSLNRFIRGFIKALGVESPATTHSEKFISGIGVFLSMSGCYLITQNVLSPESTQLFVASMAASAVLLFAVPHGALSQPWPLIMGHVISAIIGISCYQYLGNTVISASLAAGVSVLLMYYLGCLHPPGGATAFFVVSSGADVHALGFELIWMVILANVACLLIVAIAYNALFHWRRYPAHLFHSATSKKTQPSTFSIGPDDITAALQQTNSFIDVTPDDLLTLFEQASEHAEATRIARLKEKKHRKRLALMRLLKKQKKQKKLKKSSV